MKNYTPEAETASEIFTCTAQMTDASTCGEPSVEGAAFPICQGHALSAYRWVTDQMQSLADDPAFQMKFRMDSIENDRARARRAAADRVDVVYYVQVGEHIKIGYTGQLATRMKAYPLNRRLLAFESGGSGLESQRHNQFKQYLDMGNEWFRPGPELLVHINTLRLGSGSTPIRISSAR